MEKLTKEEIDIGIQIVKCAVCETYHKVQSVYKLAYPYLCDEECRKAYNENKELFS